MLSLTVLQAKEGTCWSSLCRSLYTLCVHCKGCAGIKEQLQLYVHVNMHLVHGHVHVFFRW